MESRVTTRKTMPLTVIVALLTLIAAGSVRADYYVYKDRRGVVCMTDDRNAVPPRYRSTMKIVRDETLAKRETGARKGLESEESTQTMRQGVAAQEKGAAQPEPASWFGRLLSRFPWLKPLGLLAGAFAAFMVVSGLASRLLPAQLTRIVTIVSFLVVFVFGYKLYADYLVNSYFTIKTRVIGMFMKANERQTPEPGSRPPTAGEGGVEKLLNQ